MGPKTGACHFAHIVCDILKNSPVVEYDLQCANSDSGECMFLSGKLDYTEGELKPDYFAMFCFPNLNHP